MHPIQLVILLRLRRIDEDSTAAARVRRLGFIVTLAVHRVFIAVIEPALDSEILLDLAVISGIRSLVHVGLLRARMATIAI